MEEKLNFFELENARLQGAVTVYKREIEKLQVNVRHLESSIKLAKDEISKLSKEKEKLGKLNRHLEAELERLRSRSF